MIKFSFLPIALIIYIIMIPTVYAQDWADLQHFKAENIRMGQPRPGENRVVFMGNSITEGWSDHMPEFFENKPYVNRGISGQTTPQMLLRFRQDVIELKPKVVVILAGTNDLAGNTGPATVEEIFGNICSMAELAQTNHIKVVISAVLPVEDYPWRPGLEPASKIIALNLLLRKYALDHDHVFVDYHQAMVNEKKGLLAELTYDGVHPNRAGYLVMAKLVEVAIEAAGVKH